jgi:hypothetical protein
VGAEDASVIGIVISLLRLLVERRRAYVAARKRASDGALHLVAKAWLEFKRKEWADETYRKAEFVLREYLTPALRNKSISTLSTAQVKPVLDTIAAKAPNLASKARQYVGGIVSYAIHNRRVMQEWADYVDSCVRGKK